MKSFYEDKNKTNLFEQNDEYTSVESCDCQGICTCEETPIDFAVDEAQDCANCCCDVEDDDECDPDFDADCDEDQD